MTKARILIRDYLGVEAKLSPLPAGYTSELSSARVTCSHFASHDSVQPSGRNRTTLNFSNHTYI
ncbi:hypothetical protein AG1IA_07562 [Rhizoctonia solani AG-1 IA]|uniref:Uncharacterized protein n=1 Tax=Thanatephorus cucumeris (strain AG1-IA) TaxID=983506 RepID=L8WNQ6_THACA|nr:hypothetical protein AG1IA_07562 [Rhizoctonia solani AG-1 IA]